MVIISSISVDVRGAIEFQEQQSDSDFGSKSRRQNRIATLDGGSVLQDRGYSDTDLTFTIVPKQFTEELFARLSEAVETTPKQRIACREGSFVGTISNLTDTDSGFSFLVTDDD